MLSFSKPETGLQRWFPLGLLGLLIGSLALRFWGLERFNTLVFDEVYYVKFAHNYLTQTPFFDGHPPLSKYLIAIGIWIGNQLPIGREAVNSEAGAAYSTWSYRWLNALLGALIPLVVSGIAYQLTRRRSYALLAGGLTALDGMGLVESRYALNNVHLLLLGLLGLWFLLLALDRVSPIARSGWLIASGVAFGASASIKWNGLWFLLGAYGVWAAAWVVRWARSLDTTTPPEVAWTEPEHDRSPLSRLTRISWWQLLLNLAVIPFVTYFLIWLPHLQLNAKAGIWQDFWTLQQQILEYHQRVGSDPTVHPYCSTWFSWLVMWRPVAYFYQVTAAGAPLPDGKSTLVPSEGRVIYDVHSMGNPILWWLSTAAIAIVLLVLIQHWVEWVMLKRQNSLAAQRSELAPIDLWLLVFLAVNYLANLLPWVRVSRCVFLYHYMGASIFAMMALAWFVDRWLRMNEPRFRMMGISVLLLVFLGFWFWLPVYLGLPLTPAEFRLRMIFPTWV
jgi:dolichyl-phosphate-mannose--protein O-mannosyl transferase